jgi:hypothetical protein
MEIAMQDTTLQTDEIGIRDPARMPPLLQRLSERRPEQLDYVGVSYGLTKDLLRFWKRAGYVPLYIRQTTNDLTGEHTCVMLRTLASQVAGSEGWLSAFAQGELLCDQRGRRTAQHLIMATFQISGEGSSPCFPTSSGSLRLLWH